MKKIITYLIIALIGLTIFTTSAIIIKKTTKEYIINFNTNGGNTIKSQKVKENAFVKKPETPTKKGYIFSKWEYENKEFNFKTKVKKNMTINAIWEKEDAVFTVELNIEDYKQVLQVHAGDCINIEDINVEKKEGYKIEWYKNETKINIDDLKIIEDTILIGKYIEEKIYTITFDTDGGSEVNSQKVKENKKAQEEPSPTKEGYIFEGWYLGNERYNFNTPVTQDLTIKAKWQKEASSKKEENKTDNDNKPKIEEPKKEEPKKEESKEDGSKKEESKEETKQTIPTEIFPTRIVFSSDTRNMEVSNKAKLTPIIYPQNATNKTISWTSSNPAIATVDESGNVIAKQIGEAIIIAETVNGIKGSVKINVISRNRIHFLKMMTNGNAILLESEGKYAMIDAGGSPSIGISSCHDNIFNYLKSLNIKELEFVIVSHFHWDHVYCLAGQNENTSNGFLLKNNDIKVKKIIIKDYNLEEGVHSARVKKFYERVTSIMDPNSIIKVKTEGETYNLNNFKISLYNTTEKFSISSPEDNDNANSLVAVVDFNKNNKRMLAYLPGDVQNTENSGGKSESATAQYIATKYNRVFDLYVASHHGYSSNNSNAAIGNKADRIQFKNAVVTNTFDNFCTALATQTTAANALSRIYINMNRNTNLDTKSIYFAGRKNVLANFTENGLYLTGGETLVCTYETCKDGTEAAKALKQKVIRNGETC